MEGEELHERELDSTWAGEVCAKGAGVALVRKWVKIVSAGKSASRPVATVRLGDAGPAAAEPPATG